VAKTATTSSAIAPATLAAITVPALTASRPRRSRHGTTASRFPANTSRPVRVEKASRRIQPSDTGVATSPITAMSVEWITTAAAPTPTSRSGTSRCSRYTTNAKTATAANRPAARFSKMVPTASAPRSPVTALSSVTTTTIATPR
jgi:hypothetical protein